MIDYQAWLIWGLASLFYLFEFVHRLSPSVMIPEIMQDFSANAAQVGSLSACYFYAYALLQLPVGLLLDRFSVRWLLTMACSLVSLGTITFAYSPNLMAAQISRVLIGAGSAFSFGGALKLALFWFPQYRYALIIGLTNLLGILGGLLGSGPLAQWISYSGWRPVFFKIGLIGIGLSFLMGLFIRDKRVFNTHTIANPFLKNLKLIVSNSQLWFTALFGACIVAPLITFAELWGPAYVMVQYGIDKVEAATIASITTLIGIAVGGPLIGYLSDYIQIRKPLMLMGCICACLSLLLAIYCSHLPIIIISMLYFLFGLSSSSMLLVFSLNSEKVPFTAQGTIIGFTNSLVTCISVVFQPLVGNILDKLNKNEFTTYNYRIAFLLLPLCYLAAFYFWHKIKEDRKSVV